MYCRGVVEYWKKRRYDGFMKFSPNLRIPIMVFFPSKPKYIFTIFHSLTTHFSTLYQRLRRKERKRCTMKRLMLLILLFLFFLVCLVPIEVSAQDSSVITVESKTVEVGDSFSVDITCVPIQSVKGWELKIKFDNSLLSATSVSNGNFFGSYSTFFSPGIISNENGTIINIYELIIGAGNISSPGIFVSVNFKALDHGTCWVELYDVGICNETQYVLNDVNNGTIDIYGEPDPEPPAPEPPAPEPPSPAPSAPEEETQNIDEGLRLNDIIIVATIILSMMWMIWIYIR